MKLFEFCIIYNPLPTKEEDERGLTPKSVLLIDVQRVLVNDEKEAMMLAARAIPTTHADKLDLLEIVCRAF